MTLLIRPVKSEDAHALARIFVDGWRFAYKGLLPQAFLASLDVSEREKQQQQLIERFQRTSGYFLQVAELNGSVVGLCALGASREPNASSTGEIYALYLNPAFIGQGIGYALVQDAFALLKEEKYEQASLWVLDGNSRAISFYQKAGLHITGKTKREEMFGIKILEREMEISLT